jgi:hypothetical protein
MKGSLLPGDEPDELECHACGARVPLSALGDKGDVTSSMAAVLETTVSVLEAQLAEAEERRKQLKIELRRARNALAILRGEPVRFVGVAKNWSKESRAAQGDRMRRVNERRRQEKAEARA